MLVMAVSFYRLPKFGTAFVTSGIMRTKASRACRIAYQPDTEPTRRTAAGLPSLLVHTRLLSTSSRLRASSEKTTDNNGKNKYAPLSKEESDFDGEFDTVSARQIDPNAPVDTNYLNRKDWVSHGFSYVDEDEDVIEFHGWMFTIWTLLFGGLGWLIAYKPDVDGLDWLAREAHLELRRRERLGLPVVDPDLIPRSRIVLPTEEELGDFHVHV